ncbi:MAG: hypothetical protein CVV07_05610 [Gammaproteobacteria bacterium HGW-Gammaproteobacteria-11]|nr:MAG: hypothetical protein CVV07_05610 [Gammaproteobacteria bacterium HGW-Gammaproteobacteria-11]
MIDKVMADRPSVPALGLALLITAGLWLWAWVLSTPTPVGRTLSFSLLAGAAFGVLLQRSRFCFFCITRDFVERRDARGLLGLLAALAVGTLGYHAVFGNFVPDAFSGRLPPDAHVGPVSSILAFGATIFGMGMALSGSCISAHLYRLGEGALASPFALVGVLLGFIIGFLSWNTLYLYAVQDAPSIWLPAYLGYGGSLLLQLALLAALAWGLLHHARPAEPDPQTTPGQAIWRRRWPPYVGGVLIGALAVVSYLRVAPLGVTAELGSLSRTAADAAGWLPSRLYGLDGFSGCATAVKQALLSNNGVFVIGLVLAAWASALVAGDFQPKRPSLEQIWRNLAGGVLMGFGGMLALGCTVGTLLSGIMAGAASGWVFGFFCLAGVLFGLKIKRAIGWM